MYVWFKQAFCVSIKKISRITLLAHHSCCPTKSISMLLRHSLSRLVVWLSMQPNFDWEKFWGKMNDSMWFKTWIDFDGICRMLHEILYRLNWEIWVGIIIDTIFFYSAKKNTLVLFATHLKLPLANLHTNSHRLMMLLCRKQQQFPPSGQRNVVISISLSGSPWNASD